MIPHGAAECSGCQVRAGNAKDAVMWKFGRVDVVTNFMTGAIIPVDGGAVAW